MSIRDLTPEKTRTYFETRLQGQNFTRSGKDFMAKCSFHDDRKASLSLNFGKASFYCHACKVGGGLVEFEKRFSSCDSQTATANIAEIVGLPTLGFNAAKPEAVYQYMDERGLLLFEKVRMPGKRFVQRKPDGKGGYDYKLG